MKNYTITVNGNVYDVIVEEGSTGGAAYAAPAAAPIPAAPRAAAPAPQPRQAAPAPAPVQPAPAPAPVQAAAPAPAAPRAGGQGGVKVNSPMPGKILSIKANVGQAVRMGDVILILEAMKMENEIVAPQDGTVASIDVDVNASVEAGDILATLS